MPLSLAAIDALLADNTSGDISAADLRDVAHSAHLSPGGERTRVPVDLADFAWVNQGSATATQYGDTATLRVAATGSMGIRGMFRTVTAPWTVTVRISVVTMGTDFYAGGIALRESATGEIIYFGQSSGNLRLQTYTNTTTYSAELITGMAIGQDVHWLRIVDDNANRSYHVSPDGHEWSQFYTEGRTTFLTADQAGFVTNDYSGGGPTHKVLSVQSWEQ